MSQDPSHASAPVRTPADETREIDVTIPIALIVSALIVAGSVAYGAREVSSSLSSRPAATTTTAALPVPAAQQPQPAQVQPPSPDPRKKVDVTAGVYPPLGKKTAKVTIVEFSDLECPFCKRFHDDTFDQIKQQYIDTGKVSFSYRHYPLPFHAQAPKAAEAVACANAQGKFWDLTNAIFADQANIQVADLKQKAKKVGLNGAVFDRCLDSGEKKAEVDADAAAGTTAGVTGTPTFFVNGRSLVGAQPFSQFQALIDQELGA